MLGFDDVVLCFDDVVLCFVRRRALLRSSTYFVLFARDLAGFCFAMRDVVLCSVTRSTQRRMKRVNFLAFCLSLPLLPLSPLEEVLAFPCLFLFLSRREITEEHSRTGTPTACIRCAFFYLLFLAVQAQQPKKFARFAPLCAPRAINRRG